LGWGRASMPDRVYFTFRRGRWQSSRVPPPPSRSVGRGVLTAPFLPFLPFYPTLQKFFLQYSPYHDIILAANANPHTGVFHGTLDTDNS
ncbi:MAG: hypothetical protein FWG36_01815, partial [Oscillospiraceae bacterium]|nr:hypothetical protein [Oscillospiraceae bacterium]